MHKVKSLKLRCDRVNYIKLSGINESIRESESTAITCTAANAAVQSISGTQGRWCHLPATHNATQIL